MANSFKRIAISLGLLAGISSVGVADIAGPPAGRYIINRSTSNLEQFSVNHSTVTSLAITGLTSGECVQTTTGGRLTTTGSACGSGGGGGSSLPLPGGATNYIQLSSTLQSGATFYVSSGTVSGNLYSRNAYAGTKIGTSTLFGYSLTGSGFESLQLGNAIDTPTNDFTKIRFFGVLNSTLGYFAYRNASTLGGLPSGFGIFPESGFSPTTTDSIMFNLTESTSNGTRRQKGIHLATGGASTFWNASDTKYVSWATSSTITHTQQYIQPKSTSAVDSVLSIESINADGTIGTYWRSVSGGSSGSSYPAFVLVDSNTVTWSISLNTSGALVSAVTTPPTGALKMNSIVFTAPDGSFWTTTITTSGSLVTTAGGSYASSIERVPVIDSSNITWILTVTNSGALTTS